MRSMFSRRSGNKPEPRGTPPEVDFLSRRIAVIAFALTLIGCVAGSIWLHATDRTTPELLTDLGTNSLCVLAFYLGSNRKRPPSDFHHS